MDFDLIDKLSDEELTSLYNDAITDGITDGVHTGGCGCSTSGGGIVYFGHRADGGCVMMQEHALYSRASCEAWCRGHGFSLYSYSTSCFCLRYSEIGGTYGYIGRCGT